MVIKKTLIADEFKESQTKPDSGTTFYKASLDEVQDILAQQNANIILRFLLDKRGFNALALNKFYGGGEYDDELYICVTDGVDIQIGDEEIYPEEVLETVGPDEAADYIKPATPEIIHRYVTTYELAPFDIDDVAKEMINSGIYDFLDVVKAAQDADII